MTPSAVPSSHLRRQRGPAARRSNRGGTLIGVFIGLILGLALAAGVAYYLMRSSMPFQTASPGKDARDNTPREVTKAARADHAEAASDKPRFDFYKILPGGEEGKAQADKKAPERPDRVVAGEAKERSGEKPGSTKAPERPPEPATTKEDRKASTVASAEPGAASKAAVKSGDRFWLQAGAFVNESEAENLKARLALAGWEAAVQPAPTAEKGVRFRVRLGPYDNTDELAKVKTDLGKRGFDVAVIKF